MVALKCSTTEGDQIRSRRKRETCRAHKKQGASKTGAENNGGKKSQTLREQDSSQRLAQSSILFQVFACSNVDSYPIEVSIKSKPITRNTAWMARGVPDVSQAIPSAISNRRHRPPFSFSLPSFCICGSGVISIGKITFGRGRIHNAINTTLDFY